MIDKSFLEKLEQMTVKASGILDGPDGRIFSRGELTEILEKKYYPEPVGVQTLTGLVNLYDHDPAFVKLETIALIVQYNNVHVLGHLDDRMQRNFLANAIFTPTKFRFGQRYEIADFVVALQVGFKHTDALQNIVEFLSKVEYGDDMKITDNGTYQTVTLQQRFQTEQPAKVPNPVVLQPYMTFPEIEQPGIPFVFRLEREGKNAYAVLSKIDDPLWETGCVERIRSFLKHNIVGVKVVG